MRGPTTAAEPARPARTPALRARRARGPAPHGDGGGRSASRRSTRARQAAAGAADARRDDAGAMRRGCARHAHQAARVRSRWTAPSGAPPVVTRALALLVERTAQSTRPRCHANTASIDACTSRSRSSRALDVSVLVQDEQVEASRRRVPRWPTAGSAMRVAAPQPRASTAGSRVRRHQQLRPTAAPADRDQPASCASRPAGSGRQRARTRRSAAADAAAPAAATAPRPTPRRRPTAPPGPRRRAATTAGGDEAPRPNPACRGPSAVPHPCDRQSTRIDRGRPCVGQRACTGREQQHRGHGRHQSAVARGGVRAAAQSASAERDGQRPRPCRARSTSATPLTSLPFVRVDQTLSRAISARQPARARAG